MEKGSEQRHMITIDVWRTKHELGTLRVLAKESMNLARVASRSTEQGWKDFKKKCDDLYMSYDYKSPQYNEILVLLTQECLLFTLKDLKLGAEY